MFIVRQLDSRPATGRLASPHVFPDTVGGLPACLQVSLSGLPLPSIPSP